MGSGVRGQSEEGLALPNEEMGELLSIREWFDKQFPLYLLYGMTYEQFWHMDVDLVYAYRDAFKMKKELEVEEANRNAWLNGVYVHKALSASTEILVQSMSKITGNKKNMTPTQSYPESPIDFNAAERKKLEEAAKTPEQRQEEEIAAWKRAIRG